MGSSSGIEGQKKMELLRDHKKEALAGELLSCVDRNRTAMGTVSPHGNLAGLHVPVLLLHGEGDTVIPASETLWLEKDVPAPWLRASLITPVLTHVDVGGSPPLKDKVALISFIAEMLRQADFCARHPQASGQVPRQVAASDSQQNDGVHFGLAR
jgi:pimeloyl-ACP methyl ester carboxylesterase